MKETVPVIAVPDGQFSHIVESNERYYEIPALWF